MINYDNIRAKSGTIVKINMSKAYYSPDSHIVCELWFNQKKARWEWKVGEIVKAYEVSLKRLKSVIDFKVCGDMPEFGFD